MIARITKKFFNKGVEKDELWYEAQADEQMVFSFRAPSDSKLELGDAIAFDRCFLDQEASVPVFKSAGGVRILVHSKDTKDLRDRRIIADLTFERSSTRIVLLATGEIEVTGIQPGKSGPGGKAGFDDVDGLTYYVEGISDWLEPKWNSAGPLELRKSLLDWIKAKAIPELKAAEKKFKNAV